MQSTPSIRFSAALLRTATHSEAFDSSNKSSFRNGEIRILVISPIALGENLEKINPYTLFKGKREDSLHFAEAFRPICEAYHVNFMDAAKIAVASKTDGIHMDPESHAHLADAVAESVLKG